MRLRSKNAGSRSLLPSLSSPGRPQSTRGEPEKYSHLSDGRPANQTRQSPTCDQIQPIRAAAANAKVSERVLVGTGDGRTGFRDSKDSLNGYNWIFGKTSSMSVEDKLNRGIR